MTKIEAYSDYIRNKKCVVLGLGISNLPLVDFLYGLGVKNLSVRDGGGRTDADRTRILSLCDRLASEGKINSYKVGREYLEDLDGADIIFRTPGMRPDLPEISKAVKNGAVLTSEMEEFLSLCPCKIIAVTGSDGKTTTTTLIYEMLKKEFSGTKRQVFVGGNIGKPLLSEIYGIKEDDFVVLELSSFQLMNASFKPNVAVLTNLSPNHLDWHKSFEEYIEAKKRIFSFQDDSCVFVTNCEDPITSKFVSNAETRYFSKNNVPDAVKNANILMPGVFNLENIIAAEAAVRDFVKPENVRFVAEHFTGVPHRTEFIRVLDGVRYYNSSIDSSPNRTVNTLSVFADKSVILLAGGKDKGIPYDSVGEIINRKVRVMVLVGPTAKKIAESAEKAPGEVPQIIFADNFDRAVNDCRSFAKEGENVILSPASTSFDSFANFEERGERFRQIVNAF